jgi:DNA replicative helicase MCM subunit Mcm2 (Cdc46/Mcm family)
MVAVRGMIIRVSNVIPEMKQAFHQWFEIYTCCCRLLTFRFFSVLCEAHVLSNIERGMVTTPSTCTQVCCALVSSCASYCNI